MQEAGACIIALQVADSLGLRMVRRAQGRYQPSKREDTIQEGKHRCAWYT
jgi:hypothetical protein